MIHTCQECGHEVRTTSEVDGPIEHLSDGGHRWSTTVKVGVSWGGKRA